MKLFSLPEFNFHWMGITVSCVVACEQSKNGLFLEVCNDGHYDFLYCNGHDLLSLAMSSFHHHLWTSLTYKNCIDV